MSQFTAFLVKTGFSHKPRYTIENGSVVEHIDSIFNAGVCIGSVQKIEAFIRDKDIDLKRIHRASSANPAYFRKNHSPKPWWQDFWEISGQFAISSADLLVIQVVKNNIFLITHGFARSFINPLAIEHDFGLKTALNILDSDNIKIADLFTPSEVAMRTRKQTGRKAKIQEYEINIFNSLLKNVSGKVKPEYQKFFENIGGADNIRFPHKGIADELSPILEKFIDLYNSEEYKKGRFNWIDNFRLVKNKDTIQTLDEILAKAINDRDPTVLTNFPEAFDDSKPIYYRYKGLIRKKVKSDYPYLDVVNQYYPQLEKTGKQVSGKILRTHQIQAVDLDSKKIVTAYKIYQCLFFETDYDQHTYFIESGVWYRVDGSFMKAVNAEFDKLLASAWSCGMNYDLQALKAGNYLKGNKHEAAFNKALTDHLQNNAILLDQKNVNVKQDKFEICDVMYKLPTGDYYLIHNKINHGGSALSHLFSQGNISARSLTDIEIRKLANKQIDDNAFKFSEDSAFDRKKYTVVYGIITRKNKNNQFSIPLFAKISLQTIAEAIRMLDYKIKLSFIEVA